MDIDRALEYHFAPGSSIKIGEMSNSLSAVQGPRRESFFTRLRWHHQYPAFVPDLGFQSSSAVVSSERSRATASPSTRGVLYSIHLLSMSPSATIPGPAPMIETWSSGSGILESSS